MFDENAKRIFSLYISEGAFYKQYWSRAVIDTKSEYFTENGEFDADDSNKVLDELERQKKWAQKHLSGQDLLFMTAPIEQIRKALPVQCAKTGGRFYLL